MGRIRTVKPEFFTSEDIVALSPMARLLFIALWCESDREGRMQWKPKTFKMRYFPADSCDIDAMCLELTNSGLVRLYGDGLAFVPSFSKHQHVNPRESASTLPDPYASEREKPAKARVSDASARDSDVQVGKERKGKEIHASPEGVAVTVWEDFLKIRKAKRAPMTDTALEGIRREAEKAGLSLSQAIEMCCLRGWQGFDADWLNGKAASSANAGAGAI